jgi:DNA-binding NarL/FixJ family response regulator
VLTDDYGERRPQDARRYPWSATRRRRTLEDVTATPTSADPSSDIRVLVVDDHPALRAGLEGLLAAEPGVECIATHSGVGRLLSAVRETRPDVVVLDYALEKHDGLTTCFRLKQQPNPPAVVVYSAYVDPVFAVPSAIAQADAIVAKGAPVSDLLSAIRDVVTGTAERPELDPELMEAASARLLSEDVPIAAMLVAATPMAQIAHVLGTSVDDVRRRALRIIGRLQAGDRLKASVPGVAAGWPQ